MTCRSEHEEQAALFQWVNLNLKKYPALSLMFAVPNGGKRHLGTAIKLKKEGVRAGVPDICLPVPRGKFAGLWIEMKVGKNKPSPVQKAWIYGLQSVGHRVEVCYSFEEAKDAILDYLI